MADTTVKLRPEVGTVPWREVDLTTRCQIAEVAPADFDARYESETGSIRVSKRAMRRRFKLNVVNVTDAELSTFRTWKHERTRLGINPNWGEKTVLSARYARAAKDGTPGVIAGPDPTFTRTISATTPISYATEQRDDGRFYFIGESVPRYEDSATTNTLRYMRGMRIYGQHRNYFAPSHTANGALVFTTLNNVSGLASWAWEADAKSIVADLPTSHGGSEVGYGAGLFTGRSGDNIQLSFASPPAGIVSIGLWVQGEGTFSFKLTGGATAETANTVISQTGWTLLKLENITSSGATITMQIFSRATTSWCSVSAFQFIRLPRLFGYLYNPTASACQAEEDATYYNLQWPLFGSSLYVGVEMPDLYASGEQNILGIDQGGGNRLVLRYRADTAKLSFQKTASGTAAAEWTTSRGAGQHNIIAVTADKGAYRAYENGTQVYSSGFGVVEPVARGLNVGWDGITDDYGWNGLLYFVRLDASPLDAAEVAYVSNLYNVTENLKWTKATTGRLFEIATPEHRFQSAATFSQLDLVEVDSQQEATSESA